MTEQTAQSTALTVAQQGGLAAFANGGVNAFKAFADREQVSDGQFLRMNGNTGEYLDGGGAALEPGTRMVFNIWEAVYTWQGFDGNNRPYRGPTVKINSGARLDDPVDPPGKEKQIRWTKMITVPVAFEDGSEEFIFSAKADFPSRPMMKIIKKYGDLGMRYPDPKHPSGARSPIVTLNSVGRDVEFEERGIKQKSFKYKEVLEIVGWMSVDEMNAAKNGEALPAPQAAPAQLAAPAPAPVAQAAPAPAPAPAPVATVQAAPQQATVQQVAPAQVQVIPPAPQAAPAGAPAAPGSRFRSGRVPPRTA